VAHNLVQWATRQQQCMTMRLNAPPYVYQILDKESPGGTTKWHFLVNEFWSLQKKKESDQNRPLL
jgi:hypothetical protein